MFYSTLGGIAGAPQIQMAGYVADTTPRLAPGFMVEAMDNWWGAGEFIYARANGVIRAWGLCVLTPVFNTTLNAWRFEATEVPNTANLGRMACVAMNTMAVGDYSWFAVSGIVPVNCAVSVAADTSFGIGAAGQGGANAAGKQILNARILAAGATTVVKANGFGVSGGTKITVGNTDGWFVGAYLSGTGVGAAAIISAIDPNGRDVTVTVANSAAVTGNITATYNNATIFYNVAHLNRAFYQGRID